MACEATCTKSTPVLLHMFKDSNSISATSLCSSGKTLLDSQIAQSFFGHNLSMCKISPSELHNAKENLQKLMALVRDTDQAFFISCFVSTDRDIDMHLTMFSMSLTVIIFLSKMCGSTFPNSASMTQFAII